MVVDGEGKNGGGGYRTEQLGDRSHLVEYPWTGFSTCGFDYLPSDADRRRWTGLVLNVSVAGAIGSSLALFLTIIFLPLPLVLLPLGVMIASLAVGVSSARNLWNVTSFRMDLGTLTVSTGPMSLRPMISMRCSEVRFLEAEHESYGSTRNMSSATSIVVIRTDGSRRVVLKVEGHRPELYRLARELRRLMNVQEAPEMPSRYGPPKRPKDTTYVK